MGKVVCFFLMFSCCSLFASSQRARTDSSLELAQNEIAVSRAEAGVITITADNFNAEVLESKVPVVLDAYTDWCRYCKAVAPLFAELSKELAGKVKFVKVNIDHEHTLAHELKIEALPTFLFYKNGKVVARQAGALDKDGFFEKFAHAFHVKSN